MADLLAYFNSGASICPYAKVVDKVVVESYMLWSQIARSGQVAIVVCEREGLSHDEARQWCEETHEALCEIAGCECDPPHARFNGESIFTIGMGPQYPEQHPRYAPGLCLISVSEVQIAAVATEKRQPIWRAMAERTGQEYDPNFLWRNL